ALLLLIARAREGRLGPWRFVAVGALFGLSYLARPEGLLVGLGAAVVWAVHHRRQARARLALPLMLIVMVATASPYLLFLHRATGRWTITGKAQELFFVGQAREDANGALARVADYVALQRHWRGIIPFVLSHPAKVAARVARNIWRIFGVTLPLALGPAALLGIVLWFLRLRARPEMRLGVCILAVPALTLVLMLLTFRNVRVIASVLPFLLVLGASGLSWIVGGDAVAHPGTRRWAVPVLLLCVAAWWVPRITRELQGHVPPQRSIAVAAATAAVRVAGSPERVLTTNPALSFYMDDPRLFGPPGHYAPLWPEDDCARAARDLKRKGATVALLDGDEPSPWDRWPGHDCALTLKRRFQGPGEGETICLFVLSS
ncbi:MAG TPA: hypothetical protein VNL37_08215, partial [Candidatus Polarisedimenticolia bacterium]|nr:hypothetical protein [Candidatus Polarisedimenticolia bacterium]